MRRADEQNGSLFSYVSLEERIPNRHPLRKVAVIVNDALKTLDVCAHHHAHHGSAAYHSHHHAGSHHVRGPLACRACPMPGCWARKAVPAVSTPVSNPENSDAGDLEAKLCTSSSVSGPTPGHATH
jgi:hypothetical protein